MNYEQSQVNKLGYAQDRGYAVQIENRDNGKATKHLLANAHQVARIGGILAEGSEDAETPPRDVHIRHAQMFADMLYAMNVRSGDGSSDAMCAYASERVVNGQPASAYAHVRAAMRWAVTQAVGDALADNVMEIHLDCGESVEYCVEYAERDYAEAHRHRMTPEKADENQGCWVEGSHGWRAPAVLVNKATEWGMKLEADDRALVDHYLAGNVTDVTLPSGSTVKGSDVGDCVTELSDRAEEWLNENVAPAGWTFGWVDAGEFFLWPDAQWEELNN